MGIARKSTSLAASVRTCSTTSLKYKKIQGSIADCDELYSGAMNQLDAAVKSIALGKLQDRLMNLSAGIEAPDTCC